MIGLAHCLNNCIWFSPGSVPLFVGGPCLRGALCHCQTQNNSLFEAKTARQLFIKYRFLSDSGHSVRFLNRFEKFIQSSNRTFLT